MRQVELQGTRAAFPMDDAAWEAYSFVAKPGDVHRPPRFLAPYHLRLDWPMWFLPFGSWRQAEWLLPLVEKLLENDEYTPGVTSRALSTPLAHTPRRLDRSTPHPHHPRRLRAQAQATVAWRPFFFNRGKYRE